MSSYSCYLRLQGNINLFKLNGILSSPHCGSKLICYQINKVFSFVRESGIERISLTLRKGL